VEKKFGQSSWGKKLESRRKKASLTDFERYKVAVAKTKKSKTVRAAFNKLKKQQA
jgi:large subunit ribosomal protein L14e